MMYVVGDKYPATIVKIVKSGVVVQVEGSSDTHLIHISRIAKTFVNDINNFVSVGDSFEIECVPSTVKEVEFSLLHLNIQSKVKPAPIHVDTSSQTDRVSRQTVFVRQCVHNESGISKEIMSTTSPVKASGTALDQMISKMQKSFEDKQSDMNARSKRKSK